MAEPNPASILAEFLAGRLDESAAVQELLRLDPKKHPGLSVTANLTREQSAQLEHLSKVLSWEWGKRLAPDTIPNVPYDSPEYHAFIESIPSATIDQDTGEGGTA